MHQPSITCAKMIIEAGIRRLLSLECNPVEVARSFLEQAGVAVMLCEQGGLPCVGNMPFGR
jgi:deoxycytidylate deaminase